MTVPNHMDEILGVAFGEVSEELGGVLISFLVRGTRDGKRTEGVRDPLLLHREVLESLRVELPKLLDAISASGMKSDAIPAAERPIPWNAGPTMARALQTGLFMCTSFGFYAPEPSHSAPIAYIEVTSGLDPDADSGGVEYVFALPALIEFSESIPKVLRKMDQKGARGIRPLH